LIYINGLARICSQAILSAIPVKPLPYRSAIPLHRGPADTSSTLPRIRLLQGIAVGAVAAVVIGFSWGGWMTDSAANKLAADRADTAVVAALTPVCVEKFVESSEAKANLTVLQKISTNWEQGNYLEKGGWATRPGGTSPDYHLARACAEKLVQAKTAAQ
jgi:hypothetical protein